MPRLTMVRHAAVRTRDGADEYIDLSTLAATRASAEGLATKRDMDQRMAIARREAHGFVRIVEVEIRELPQGRR